MSARSTAMVTLTEAAALLGVHYMTAYRYVRTGRLPAIKDGSEWRVRAADVADLMAAASRSRQAAAPNGAGLGRPAPHGRRRTNWAHRAEERLVAGDEAGAWAVVEAAMSAGMSPEDLYLDVLAPSLCSIGDRWATGELTVADEHRASGVTHRLIGRLGPRFARRGRKRGTVVLAAPPGETHALPLALFADLLRARSFDVCDLGSDVPSDSLASTVAATARLVAVGLCATTSGNEVNIRAAVAAVRGVTNVPVLVGGGAILDGPASAAVGADVGGLPTGEALLAFEHLARVHA